MHRISVASFKQFLLFATLFAIGGIGGFGAISATAGGTESKSLVLRISTINPDPIIQGQGSRVRLVFTNNMGEDFLVEDMTSSCSCFRVTSSSNFVVKNSTSVNLYGVLKTNASRERASSTLCVRGISKPGVQREVRCSVNALVSPNIIIEPAVLDFGILGSEQQELKHVRIRFPHAVNRLDVALSPDSEGPFRIWSVKELTTNEFEVVIACIGSAPNSARTFWSSQIIVSSSDLQLGKEHLQLRASSQQTLVARPKSIYLNRSGASKDVYIQSRINHNSPVQLEYDMESLDVNFLKNTVGNGGTITVSAKTGCEVGEYSITCLSSDGSLVSLFVLVE